MTAAIVPARLPWQSTWQVNSKYSRLCHTPPVTISNCPRKAVQLNSTWPCQIELQILSLSDRVFTFLSRLFISYKKRHYLTLCALVVKENEGSHISNSSVKTIFLHRPSIAKTCPHVKYSVSAGKAREDWKLWAWRDVFINGSYGLFYCCRRNMTGLLVIVILHLGNFCGLMEHYRHF